MPGGRYLKSANSACVIHGATVIRIFFLHFGNSPYLKYSLYQARWTNPGSRRSLPGGRDKSRLSLCRSRFYAAIRLEDLRPTQDHNVHLSSNSYELESVPLQAMVYSKHVSAGKRSALLTFSLQQQLLLNAVFRFLPPAPRTPRVRHDDQQWLGGPRWYLFFRDRTVLAALCSFIIESDPKKKISPIWKGS